MTAITLSIVIPTYNRGELLKFLLESICADFQVWPPDLQLVVSDNASTDNTSAVLHDFVGRGIPLQISRNTNNIGMDGNLAACFSLATGKYFWQIGDDELLYRGTASYILNICRLSEFGLVHINSSGLQSGQQILELKREIPENKLAQPLDSADMIRAANVYLTFISANIVNRQLILKTDPNFNPQSEIGSNVPQLAWICAVLKSSNAHLHIRAPLFGALHGNTGGYKLIEVFAVNFVGIIARLLEARFPQAKRIASNAVLLRLLPAELKSQLDNLSHRSNFANEDVKNTLDRIYKSNFYYRFLVNPWLTGSTTTRKVFYFAIRAFNKIDKSLGYRLL